MPGWRTRLLLGLGLLCLSATAPAQIHSFCHSFCECFGFLLPTWSCSGEQIDEVCAPWHPQTSKQDAGLMTGNMTGEPRCSEAEQRESPTKNEIPRSVGRTLWAEKPPPRGSAQPSGKGQRWPGQGTGSRGKGEPSSCWAHLSTP